MIKYENKHFIYDRPMEKGLRFYLRKVLSLYEGLYYKIVTRFTRVNTSVNKKYNTTICAIFKNEGLYLKEWIEYHIIVGIEHFYLYNNFSDDNFLDILQPYIDKGIVTLIEWQVPQGQMSAYNHCIVNYKSEAKWIGFIDLDEFIVPNKEETVYSFLKGFERKSPAVIIYWKFFGTSGKMDRDTNGLVTEDFTVSWNKYANIGKCFYNTAFDFDPNFKRNNIMHHYMWGKWKNVSLPPVNIFNKVCTRGFDPYKSKFIDKQFPIQINHYFTKSFREYLTKKGKGDVYFEESPHTDDYFYKHETKCKTTDYSIFKYLIKLKTAMGFKR